MFGTDTVHGDFDVFEKRKNAEADTGANWNLGRVYKKCFSFIQAIWMCLAPKFQKSAVKDQ
jgi:hypothetical protein